MSMECAGDDPPQGVVILPPEVVLDMTLDGDLLPGDVVEVLDAYGEQALPRYLEGHQAYGDAREHHAAPWWLAQATEEAVDLLFYLEQVRARLAPREGRLRVYLAGPYSAKCHTRQHLNIEQARCAMAAVVAKGHDGFCPHSMSANMDHDFPSISRERWLELDLHWLSMCHCILMLPGWESSAGAIGEKEAAERWGLPAYYRAGDLPTPEEVRRGWPLPE